MPADRAELEVWMNASLAVRIGESWVELPPASAGNRPPLPPSLCPVTWLVAPTEASLLEALERAAGQAGVATLPARVDGRDACALHGATRARAMKLAYRRKQSLIVGLFPGRVEVVYTGLDSRS